jgi:hypothetical protein
MELSHVVTFLPLPQVLPVAPRAKLPSLHRYCQGRSEHNPAPDEDEVGRILDEERARLDEKMRDHKARYARSRRL